MRRNMMSRDVTSQCPFLGGRTYSPSQLILTIIATCSPLSSICGTCLSKVSIFPSIFFTITLGAVSSSIVLAPLGIPALIQECETIWELRDSMIEKTARYKIVIEITFHRGTPNSPNLGYERKFSNLPRGFLSNPFPSRKERRTKKREKDGEKTGKSWRHGETAKEEGNVGGSRGKTRKVVYVPARVRQLRGEAEGRRAIRLGGSTRSRWDTCTRQTSILEVALQGRSACHPRRLVSTTSRPLRIS